MGHRSCTIQAVPQDLAEEPSAEDLMLGDVGYAVRSLRRWRLGAAMALATLTIAIGTTTSLYAFLRASLANQAPRIEGIDVVARVYASSRSLGIERAPVSMVDFQSALATASSFESIAAYQSDERVIAVGGTTATISVGQVTELFFQVFRARAASGRLISAQDARTREPVMVVSDSIWRKYFEGRTPGEATLNMAGTSWTIVGVLPPEFGFSFLGINADVWTWMPTQVEAPSRSVSVIARLKTDRSWTAASAELGALATAHAPNGQWTWQAIPVRDDLNKRVSGASAFILGPALIVLLIGCVNVSCMLLARGIERDVELSVRCALGATRARIVRQLTAEHFLLAAVAGVLGWLLALGILRLISSRMAAFAAAPDLAPDASMLLVALGVSFLASVLFGALPAIRISRRDVAASLKGATASASARFAGYHTRDLVVFTELTLAVVLIVVTGMWLKLFAELQQITPAFAADQVVAARVQAADLNTASQAVAALPGVIGVAAVSNLPGGRSSSVQLQAENGRLARGARVAVQPSFFTTVGLPILRGRTFDSAEANANSNTVIMSEALAADLWPGEDPIGNVVNLTTRKGTVAAVIIGVSADALNVGRLARFDIVPPDVYVPFDRADGSNFVVLARANGNVQAIVRPIEVLLGGGQDGVRRVSILANDTQFVRDESLFLVRLLGAFGLVALGLAATGVFGVLSQSVSQRTTEFGVRMAIGASSSAVLLMVVMREAKLIVAAIATGAVATVLVTRAVLAELVMVSGSDAELWIAVAVLCVGLAAGAVALATRRIVRLDPWTILRNV
jgi:putative ABC transport system permease protein